MMSRRACRHKSFYRSFYPTHTNICYICVICKSGQNGNENGDVNGDVNGAVNGDGESFGFGSDGG